MAVLAIFVVVATIAGCATTPKTTMTPMQIQSLQTHEFETTKGTAFNSVLSVFQNLGYIVESADKDTGFITATSPSSNATGFWEAMNGVTATGETKATAFVEEIHPGTTRVRLNFVNSEHRSAARGQSNTLDNKILDAKVYQNAFNKIGTAIFVREGQQ